MVHDVSVSSSSRRLFKRLFKSEPISHVCPYFVAHFAHFETNHLLTHVSELYVFQAIIMLFPFGSCYWSHLSTGVLRPNPILLLWWMSSAPCVYLFRLTWQQQLRTKHVLQTSLVDCSHQSIVFKKPTHLLLWCTGHGYSLLTLAAAFRCWLKCCPNVCQSGRHCTYCNGVKPQWVDAEGLLPFPQLCDLRFVWGTQTVTEELGNSMIKAAHSSKSKNS